jgi:hypothetical protein
MRVNGKTAPIAVTTLAVALLGAGAAGAQS